jgi:hypothetical protein
LKNVILDSSDLAKRMPIYFKDIGGPVAFSPLER